MRAGGPKPHGFSRTKSAKSAGFPPVDALPKRLHLPRGRPSPKSVISRNHGPNHFRKVLITISMHRLSCSISLTFVKNQSQTKTRGCVCKTCLPRKRQTAGPSPFFAPIGALLERRGGPPTRSNKRYENYSHPSHRWVILCDRSGKHQRCAEWDSHCRNTRPVAPAARQTGRARALPVSS